LQRLTEVCRANGGVYVKAGQFAAAFGAVPNEYRKHLALLQDKAKPRPFHVVDRVLRLELGAGAEEVFAEFSAEATAAASLAQVG
jgi:aarF domain-containing kinase